jgi:hypothetical protein
MSRPRKTKCPDKGDFVRVGTQWYYIAIDWRDGVHYLATPMTGPFYPERRSQGPPRVVKLLGWDELLKQGGAEGAEADPLKGSGR